MNASLNKALVALAGAMATAFLGAFSMFLSKIFEPVIAWFTFTSMKLLIKLTKSDTLRSLYKDMKKGYEEQKNPYGGEPPMGPPGGYYD